MNTPDPHAVRLARGLQQILDLTEDEAQAVVGLTSNMTVAAVTKRPAGLEVRAWLSLEGDPGADFLTRLNEEVRAALSTAWDAGRAAVPGTINPYEGDF